MLNSFKLFDSFLRKDCILHPSLKTIIIRISLHFSNSINFISQNGLINFFFWASFLWFFSRLLYLLTRFLWFLELKQLNLLITFHLVSRFLFLEFLWMLWMLVTVNKLKHMSFHGSHTSQITTFKVYTYPNIFQCVKSKTL